MDRETVDRVLDSLAGRRAALATGMYAVETHPGHVFLRDATLTGATAELWQRTGRRIDGLWAEFAVLQEALDRITALRAARSRPGRTELAELTRLLEQQLVRCNRLETAHAQVVATLTEVADRESAVAQRLAGLDAVLAEAAAPELATRLDALRASTHGDPMGTDLDVGPAAALTAAIRTAGERHRELLRRRATYPARLAALRDALDALVATEEATRQAYALATVKIRDPRLPPAADSAPALRRRLDALADPDDGIPALEAAVAAAVAAAGERHRFATGLLERRDELRGRLQAYQMKAVRTGRSEDADLPALYLRARTLLWTAPCDLRAATGAVAAYQRSLNGGGTP